MWLLIAKVVLGIAAAGVVFIGGWYCGALIHGSRESERERRRIVNGLWQRGKKSAALMVLRGEV